MTNYIEQLKKQIKSSEEKINIYNDELNRLNKNRKSYEEKNYKAREEELKVLIKENNSKIEESQNILSMYNLTDSFMDDIKILVNLYNETKDPVMRDQITQEINDKREYVNNSLKNELPEVLSNELSKKYDLKEEKELVDDNKIKALKEEKEKMTKELKAQEAQVTKSINKIQDIFKEERELLSEGPFATLKELDAFNELYMTKKVYEDNKLQAAKRRKQQLEKTIEVLDKKIEDRMIIVRDAKSVNLSADEYENIINRITKRAELDKYLNSIGLQEVVNKKNKILAATPEEKEQKNKLIKQYVDSKKAEINNTKEVKEISKPKTKKVTNKRTYGYKTVLANLVQGLEPKAKDGKRYRAANLEVRKEFKEELRSGNYLYDIVHVVPAVIKLPIQLIRKVSGKITYRKEAKERMEIIKDRLNNLSDEDLTILWKEYANHVEEEKMTTGLNILIDERVSRFIREKVNDKNESIENKYIDLMTTMKELDAVDTILIDNELTAKARRSYESYRKKILKGKAKEIAELRNEYEEAKSMLSSGLHGFKDNIKATETKMNYVGYRFSKEHDLDVSLVEKEAKLERAEKNAILEKDDEMALRVFVEHEKLLKENTKIENSIFGKRSTGKKYYSPLALELNYQNDPFVRDIFTTIAVVGATATAINAMNANKVNVDQQKSIEHANEVNREAMEKANRAGEELTSKGEVYKEGMIAQNYQDSLNVSNVLERKALDQSSEVWGGWSVGTKAYYDARNVAQSSYVDFYNNTKNAIENVTAQYSAGNISQLEAMEMIQSISNNSQSTLANVVSESLPHIANYARDHSQFDLSGIQDAMYNIVSNPEAITNMNQAMIDSTMIGNELTSLTTEQIALINELPQNITSTILTAASASALALKVNNTVKENKRKGYYGNRVTELLDEYIESEEPITYTDRRVK